MNRVGEGSGESARQVWLQGPGESAESVAGAGLRPEPGELARRGLLLRMLAGLQGAAAILLAVPVVRYLLAPLGARPAASVWQRLCLTADVPPGATVALKYRLPQAEGFRVSSADTATVWVARRTGRLDAFRAVCTHLGCSVAWEERREAFVCPCHGGLFSRDGQVLAGPPPRPLERLEIKDEGGALWVRPARGRG